MCFQTMHTITVGKTIVYLRTETCKEKQILPGVPASGSLSIIYLPRQLGGRFHPFWSLTKGVVLMYVTYENLFTFVLVIVAIITLVKNFYDKRKK